MKLLNNSADNSTATRPPPIIVHYESEEVKWIFVCLFSGIINSEGKLWKDQRRFLHEKLRHFGMSYLGNRRELMQERIMVSKTMHFTPINAPPFTSRGGDKVHNKSMTVKVKVI